MCLLLNIVQVGSTNIDLSTYMSDVYHIWVEHSRSVFGAHTTNCNCL
jgi:hypothetical protein